MGDLERLVYRSHLLGADRSVCNWKGGNTSTKGVIPNFQGDMTRVMWVKGSGSDLLTMRPQDFTCLALDPVLELAKREAMTDQEMVAYLRHCMVDPDQPRASIETLMHAFLPFSRVDHTHPDSVIALCNCKNGDELTRQAFGSSVAWIPYRRPGFALAKQVARAVEQNPNLRAVFLAKHGLVTWGETDRAAYESTLSVINDAAEFLASRAAGKAVFGGIKVEPWSPAKRKDWVTEILPVIRGTVSRNKPVILHFDDSEDVLELVNSREGRTLALTGSACPDHLVHTKYRPLWVDFEPASGTLDELKKAMAKGIEEYADQYGRYQAGHRRPGDPEGDPYPRVLLIPGIGMVTTGKDKSTAENTAGLYHRAIAVMRYISPVDAFESMTEAEAYDVEYWPLELYKLTLAPPPREFAGRVALVTGAAGAIGRATSLRLAADDAHVVLTDIDEAGLRAVANEIEKHYGKGRALAVAMDVTREEDVVRAFREAVQSFGGVDIVVSNAGLAASAPIVATSAEQWDRLHAVLSRGYFLVAREAFRILQEQGRGGSIVFVTSKNSLVASKGAAAYNAAKAAELHLARTLAEEGGPLGIRVNSVAPDAVLEGSKIWSSEWRRQRATAYGIAPEELEEYYRSRTLLRVNVHPEDVAEAIAFLAGSRSSRTTGCTITVDGGVSAAFVR